MNYKDFNASYTSPTVCTINGVSINNTSITQYSEGTIKATVNYGPVQGIRYNVPQILPTGIFSIPNTGDKGLVINAGIGQSIPTLIGYMLNKLDERIKATEENEITLFSKNYFINLLNNALKIEYNSTNMQEASLPIGEALVTILLDIITQFQNLVTDFNNFVTTYNSHQHNNSAGDTGPPLTPATSITIDANITSDKDFINAGKLLISENGQTIVR